MGDPQAGESKAVYWRMRAPRKTEAAFTTRNVGKAASL
ncbi:hypothetical protein SAMN05216174_101276 [Actinokineospora iranica]|uniref:Uncharacterized protein n=1 Tax=Actinokineospora iranica TaxID=1271860 RepID=A0A1G6J8R0_9PSEU|nr:hypothetical protein SAMN05216174_101276 [Actinokineospora iranica]